MKELKKTLVLGASVNPERYAYKAIEKLRRFQHPVIAIGLKEGKVGDVEIEKMGAIKAGVDTITLYVGPSNQAVYYNYLLQTKPNRIIFNPGTENSELVEMAEKAGIECLEACTLVLLATGDY